MHRVGLVLGAIPIVFFTIMFAVHASQRRIDSEHLQLAAGFLTAAVALYAASWVSGWVIAGFMRDEE